MKKEFKAPVVETRELNALNSIMDGGMLISGNGVNGAGTFDIGAEIAEDFKQWKGKQN